MSKKTEIVRIENMKLYFRSQVHRPNSLRDIFVQTLSHPLETLLRKPVSLEIIRQLNLTIRQGDRLAVLGVNGAGKTSLCRAIAGFYQPTSGKIKVTGKVRAIFETMVGIYPELTGRENAEILAGLLYPSLDSRAGRIAEALEFTELGNFLNTPFKYYSNGMQARLCLSILTMAPTDLLILDEVFEGADRFFREKMAKRTLSVIENSGAVIFVSHNEDQLMRVCNRSIVLQDGLLAFDGPVAEGIKYYQNAHRGSTLSH